MLSMGKRVHIYAGFAVVALGMLLMYFTGFRFTGFAVIQQQNQTDFSLGTYENVEYNVNDSRITLSVNQTSGTYTSEILDAGSDSKWNNLSWQGVGNLTFEVRSCSSIDCSNSTFISSDLNNLNLSGQYFQYKVSFYDNDSNSTAYLETINVDYTLLSYISLSITQPSDGVTVSSQSNINLEFSVTGADNCWYNLDSGLNITISNCTLTTFNVGSDGTYTLNLYANNSNGNFEYQSSSFTIDTSSQQSGSETPSEPVEESVAKESETSITGAVIEDFSDKVVLSSEIQNLTMNPNSSKRLVVSAGNIGTSAFTSCKLKGSGILSSWINPVNGTEQLNPGDTKEFEFDLVIPAETNETEYTVLVSLSCQQFSKTTQFIVNVVNEKIGFELINAQRTSDDEVTVTYLLKELSNSEQNVTLDFQIVDSDNNKVSEIQENKVLLTNSTEEFETIIPINESLVVVNESSDESIEKKFELIVILNSQIYSSSIQEKISIGIAPVSGFAVFGGEEGSTGRNVGIVIFTIMALIAVLFVVRRIRTNLSNKYK